MTTFKDVQYICPFWHRLSINVIECGEIIDGAILSHRFASRAACDAYANQYCRSFNYERCPIYQMAAQKIAESDDRG